MIKLRSKNQLKQKGFSLIELLVVVAMSSMIFVSLSSVVGEMFSANEMIKSKTDLYQQADFAMDKIVQLLANSSVTNTKKNDPDEVHIDVAMDPTWDMNKDGTADGVAKMHLEWKGGDLILDTGKLTFDITGDGQIKKNQDEVEFFITDLIKTFTYSTTTPSGSSYELATIRLMLSDGIDSVTLETKVRLGGQL